MLLNQHQRWRGDGTPEGLLGPVISVAEAARFTEAMAYPGPGIRRLAGNPRPIGAFVEPILQCVDDAAMAGHTQVAEEHFGPVLTVIPYDDVAMAVAALAANPFRLSAAVWTRDVDRFRAVSGALPYGLVGRNRNTAGARSDLPFGGCGQSGNGRPAALAAGAIFADETVVLDG